MARTLRSADNGVGHNSGFRPPSSLKDAVDRIVEIMRQIQGSNADIKEILAAADDSGFGSKKAIRARAREHFKDPEVLKAELDEAARMREELGMFADTALGGAAVQAAEQRDEQTRRKRRRSSAETALDKAQAHLNGQTDIEDLTKEREATDDDPFGAGKAAALQGFNDTRNPFEPGSDKAGDWMLGHAEGIAERTGAA